MVLHRETYKSEKDMTYIAFLLVGDHHQAGPPPPIAIGVFKLNTDGVGRKSCSGTTATCRWVNLIRGHMNGPLEWVLSPQYMETNSSLMGQKCAWAIRDGFNFAIMENIHRLEVEVAIDALGAIQLISASNIDNHPLSNIIIYDCKFLMRRFDEINFKHIYWKANQCASFSGRDVFLFSYSFMYC